MAGFRVRYDGSRMQLVCTTCQHVCEVEDAAEVADVATEFARLHPDHAVSQQHADACPEGSVPAR